MSGVIIRPDPEDPTNSSKMSVMLQNDVKGWIPHFVVNKFAASAPVEWQNGLATYYSNVYSKRGKSEEEDSAQKGQSTTEEAESPSQSVGAAEGEDSTQKGQSTTEEAESPGQSVGAAEGGETEGQGADAGGGESQVTSEGNQKAETETGGQPETAEVTTEVTVETGDDAVGGAGELGEGEAPA